MSNYKRAKVDETKKKVSALTQSRIFMSKIHSTASGVGMAVL